MSSTSAQFWTQQFMKVDGTPYTGVRVFHYVAGNTTTNLDVWQDAAMNAAHNNPVVGDVTGRVFFYGSGTYRLLVKTSTDDGNVTLYDWDPVELVHHTATVRAEDKAISLPAAYAAARGRIFGVTDGGGDLLSVWIQRTASVWAKLLTEGQLSQMLEFAKGTDIASSADVTIPSDGNFFDITGTNDIETFSGFTGYPVIYTRTLQALTFVHSSNLQLLSHMDRLTLADQITCWIHIGAAQWVELFFTTISMFGDNIVTEGSVLVGNGASAVTELPLPPAGRVLGHSGVVDVDPFWGTGLVYHGPTTIVAGSTRPHEGIAIISAGLTNMLGIHYYSDFTLNSGATIALPAFGNRLILVASNSITINGVISAEGAGSGPGGDGFSQAGGGGGGHAVGASIVVATAGGRAIVHSITVANAGAGGGQNASGGTPSTLTGSQLSLADMMSIYGGAGGGRGGSSGTGVAGGGGFGGGSLVLMAPTITFGSGSLLNTSGGNGSAGANAGGGGGGGAGNIYMLCQSYTNNGVTFTQNGGSGGGATGGGGGGGQGAPGVRQIMIYGT